MDYKEKVIALLNSQELTKEQKEKLENIFPELKEDNDERIRKELIEQIAYIIPNDDEVDGEGNTLPTYQERIDKYRVWLEKQGEKKPTEDAKKLDADKVIEWLNDQACLGWIEDIEVEKFVEQFKKDFEI